MKTFIALFSLSVLSSAAFSEVVSEIYCFNSGGNKPVRFEMRTYFDTNSKWEGGFIKYANAKAPITIVLKNTQTEILNKDRPYQSTKTWLEISDNKVTGEYEMMSQGANVYSMQYSNIAKKKLYNFEFDPNIESSLTLGCKW